MQSFSIQDSIARIVKIYQKDDRHVPSELFCATNEKPDLSDFKYPLPSKKSDYTCLLKVGNISWLGAKTGLTRFDPDTPHECDRIMFFSATRELKDNEVKALYVPEGNTENIWVLTATGASHIELKNVTAEEKADMLTQETLQYVSRRGMVTQRELTVPGELFSRVPYGHSDNSGCFTAGFAIGELFKYAVYKRELGADDMKTAEARKSAVKAVEACQLLMYIAGRGDGFVARTYIVPTEPLPNDGLFFRKENGKAVCLRTSASIKRGMDGLIIDASHPVPERLARLYKNDGYSDEGIIYKGDTSSDEITLHYLLIYFAHEILGEEDPELDELLKGSAKATLNHILSHSNEFYEADGHPTTWAKWSKKYFGTVVGWSDGCLNAAELLMYLRVVMHITGEKGEWQKKYDELAIDEGYARLTSLHDTRFHLSAQLSGCEQVEDLMYGDNMLATAAYWILITLEENSELKELYRSGFKGWNGTFRREHNPAYDFPYLLSCPGETVNTDMLCDWFRRSHITRLATAVSMKQRHDVAKRTRMGGTEETSFLLEPDERFISKYDRNPYEYKDGDNGDGLKLLESCYVYTFAYWIGRYYGFII